MKTIAVWVGVFVALLFIAGKTPKQEQDWLIIETGAVLFWSITGLFLFARGLYRIFISLPRGH